MVAGETPRPQEDGIIGDPLWNESPFEGEKQLFDKSSRLKGSGEGKPARGESQSDEKKLDGKNRPRSDAGVSGESPSEG